jgi:predicted extracellular nuclease
MQKYLFLLSALVLLGACKKEEKKEEAVQQEQEEVVKITDDFTVAFYNVENLFDTKDDPSINDDDFLPDGDYKWTYERYLHKLDQLGKVIGQIDEGKAPEMIGLCEVENRQVLEDLVQTSRLREAAYQIVHEESPDERGIDVALLYHPNFFKPFRQESIETVFPEDADDKTRDILFVSGTTGINDTLHVLVNHFPSRRGGAEASEPKRMFVARQLRTVVDSLLADNPQVKIIIMGDFNDTPTDKSIKEILQASGDMGQLKSGEMFNAMYALEMSDKGTYCYRDNWEMLDQIILSTGLVQQNGGYHYVESSAMIFEKPWLKQKEEKYLGYPDRTYGGRKYLGGYSDHFAVKVELRVAE